MRKGQEEGDFYTLCEIVLEVLLRHGWGKKDEEVPKKMQGALREMVRSSGCGLPHISSLVGGLVSPEVMKLVTSQYIPMNGVCIFDAYRSTTGVLELGTNKDSSKDSNRQSPPSSPPCMSFIDVIININQS
ncbi:hypothetical protein Pst134EA_030481 [Puccinia striiformis f. sp. tritici]|uniref:hypothetical protein n=1 Tax=Puccinia striiformis f. sp. tritici TaxID=168172 RepID=UPI0020084BF3|nr:hypothetical protein Pst134EA_030481 [Puccinia striiformis f. sp. tritici]KAH9446568.1 hypothetical protein Pst134EA_030481 [Puccinia striiformis f. sp. tritici]